MVEIIVVLGILLTLTLITYPAFRQFYPRIKLSTASQDIVFKLRETQQLAITEQIVHLLRFEMTQETYTLIRIPDPEVPENEEILEINYLPEEVDFESINNLNNNEVRYNSSGAPSDSGTVVLTTSSGDSNITIDIRPSGYVRSY